MDTRVRDGRRCDPEEILQQIGLPTIFAVSGGRWYPIKNGDGDSIGVGFVCGGNRFVEVVLDFMDTYVVSRYRRVVSGKNRGQYVTEYTADMVYCDGVSESVYTAGCWK